MKTTSYKALRAVCYLSIFGATLATFSYLGFFLYSSKLLMIEKSFSAGSRFTLHGLSVYLIYLNLLSAALNGYAFNIASKMLLTISMWFTITVDIIGVCSVVYLRYFAKDAMSNELQRNLFSGGGHMLVLQQTLRLNETNYKVVQEAFMGRYSQILLWFTRFELLSALCFGVVAVGAAIRQFMKVHVRKMERPSIITSTIIEPISLRSNPVMIKV